MQRLFFEQSRDETENNAGKHLRSILPRRTFPHIGFLASQNCSRLVFKDLLHSFQVTTGNDVRLRVQPRKENQ